MRTHADRNWIKKYSDFFALSLKKMCVFRLLAFYLKHFRNSPQYFFQKKKYYLYVYIFFFKHFFGYEKFRSVDIFTL